MVKENFKSKLDGNDLDLSLMSFSEIPVKEIAAIPKATQIDLSCNHLISIPEAFCNLKYIVKLDLSRNSIDLLPGNFGELTKLQYLDLYNNKLTVLPLSFCRLQNLKWLDLKGNPLSPHLKSVAGDCLDAKQCQNCARKVVQFMLNVQSEVLLEQENRMKRDEELAAQRKLKEEHEQEVQRKAKKAAKERKRAALQADKQKQNQQQDTFSDDSSSNLEYNKFNSDPAHEEKKKSSKLNSDGMGCLGFLLKILFTLLTIVSCGLGLLFIYTKGDFSESSIRLALQAIFKDAVLLLDYLEELGLKCFAWLGNEGWEILKTLLNYTNLVFWDAMEITWNAWTHVLDKVTAVKLNWSKSS